MRNKTICLPGIVCFLMLSFVQGADVPPEFIEVDGNAGQIYFEDVLAAINCGNAAYEVRDTTFHAWGDPALSPLCAFSGATLLDPGWNAAWTGTFVDADLDQLDEVYKSIAYLGTPMSVTFSGLDTEAVYTIQVLITAGAQNWDHGGSIKVVGIEEIMMADDFHLNTFPKGVPYVLTVDDILPAADGTIRLEYFRADTWVPSPALDPNWIWQGIILTGPPVQVPEFPTDLQVAREAGTLSITWSNHEPSTSGMPYDELSVLVDGVVRRVFGEGPAVVNEVEDVVLVLDLTAPENVDLTDGLHVYQINTVRGGFQQTETTVFGLAPIRVAMGDYGDPGAVVETSDGRLWTSDTHVLTGDRHFVDWQANADPVNGIVNADEFGLDPLDPVDQSLFARFRWENRGTQNNHMQVRIPLPDGTYDVMLYFWEYASGSIFNRTAQVSVEGGPVTFLAYADEEGIYAANPEEAWRLAFESVQVDDGVLTMDFLPGWSPDGNATLSAVEVLASTEAPKAPANLQATTTGDNIYHLSWELPEGADYTQLNILSRMSGQKISLEDPAATSYIFEQEIFYPSTVNEAFVLQARSGNTFYPQIQAGAGVTPMTINAGGAGGDLLNAPVETPVMARGLTWVSDLPYVESRHDFVGPLVSGDRNHANFDFQPFQVVPGSPSDELDPPFDNPEGLLGDEAKLLQELRWTYSVPNRDPIFMPMRWEIPINPGRYFVRLYLGEGHIPDPPVYRAAEIWAEQSEHQRIYYHGMMLDEPPAGMTVIQGGSGEVTLMEFDQVAVDDGYLTLNFNSISGWLDPYDNNPTVSAIEILGESVPPPETFKRGDVNGDDGINLADAISLLSHLFADLPMPACPDAADGNDDGKLDLADAIKILGHLFSDEGPLPDPFGDCDVDPTEDGLEPCVYPPCQ